MEQEGQNGSATGPVLYSAGNVSSGGGQRNGRSVQFADGQMNTSSSTSSASSTTTTNQQQSAVNGDQPSGRSSLPQSRGSSSSWFSLWSSPSPSTSSPPSSSSSSSASSSQRDYVTNNESKCISSMTWYIPLLSYQCIIFLCMYTGSSSLFLLNYIFCQQGETNFAQQRESSTHTHLRQTLARHPSI